MHEDSQKLPGQCPGRSGSAAATCTHQQGWGHKATMPDQCQWLRRPLLTTGRKTSHPEAAQGKGFAWAKNSSNYRNWRLLSSCPTFQNLFTLFISQSHAGMAKLTQVTLQITSLQYFFFWAILCRGWRLAIAQISPVEILSSKTIIHFTGYQS